MPPFSGFVFVCFFQITFPAQCGMEISLLANTIQSVFFRFAGQIIDWPAIRKAKALPPTVQAPRGINLQGRQNFEYKQEQTQ